MDRITKQMELVFKEMATSHGVCILRKQLGVGNNYEYVFINTPPQHIASTSRVAQARQIADVSTNEEQLKIHKLIKRIYQNELVEDI
jgi:hypothetical protein